MSRAVMQQALEALEACNDYIAPHTVQGEKDGDMADAAIATIKAALAQPYPEYDRGFSNGWDKCAKRQATVQPALPPCHSADAVAFIEKHLALRNYPANSRKAARAGWDAACALLNKTVQPDNTAKLYEELRSIIDGGSESFTHKDAVQYLKYNLVPLKWTPEDTAYRPGGLAQPEQEPDLAEAFRTELDKLSQRNYELRMENARLKSQKEQEPVGRLLIKDGYISVAAMIQKDGEYLLYTSPPKRQPLTDEQIDAVCALLGFAQLSPREVARAIEASHNIGDKT